MDSEGELDRSFIVRSSKLVVALMDNISKEEDEMALNPRKGLKDLLVRRKKRSSSKDASKS